MSKKLPIEEEKYNEKQVEKIYKEVVLEENTNKKEIILDLKAFNRQEKVIK